MMESGSLALATGLVGFVLVLCSCSTVGKTGRVIPTKGRGPEDLVLVRLGGRPALISGTASRARYSEKGKADGRLEVWRPGRKAFEEIIGQKVVKGAFVPVGIYAVSSYHGEDRRYRGAQLVYVVNNVTNGAESIEIFRVRGEGLEHLASIDTMLDSKGKSVLSGANSIAVTAEGRVVVSNFGLWNPFRRDRLKTVSKESGHLATAQGGAFTVVCFDPSGSIDQGTWRVLMKGVDGPNGLSLSADEKELMVCSYYGKRVWGVRWKSDGTLDQDSVREIAKLPFCADNIHRVNRNVWTVTGQRHFFLTGLYLAFCGSIPSRGGYVFIDGRSKQEPSYIEHPGVQAPATTVPLGGKIYTGGIIEGGVYEFDSSPEQLKNISNNPQRR